MASVPVKPLPAGPPPENLEERFQQLATAWHEAVAHHSSSSIQNNHPAYQEIIRLGTAVVPLLLRDLEMTGRHWFWALKMITGAHPVPAEDRGQIDKVTQAWLRWGRENGIKW